MPRGSPPRFEFEATIEAATPERFVAVTALESRRGVSVALQP